MLYPIFPPKNGGMLRNYFLCLNLSKHFDLTLLILHDNEEFIAGQDGYEWNNNIRIVSPPPFKNKGIHKYLNAIKGRYYQNNWKQPAGEFSLRMYPELKRLVKEERFDVVLFEHLNSTGISPLVNKYLPGALKILDLHNVEHLLFEQLNDIRLLGNKERFESLKHKESNLDKIVDVFFACSEIDKGILEELNGDRLKGFTVPNGVDTNRCSFDEHKNLGEPSILFCGSLDYEPNIDGLKWFIDEIWPLLTQRIPTMQLTIIGRNSSRDFFEELKNISNINFVGEVPETGSFYKSANVSIVPLRKGSGTRLKILEAMSYGNSIVATSIGAEGIDITNEENILIADDVESFVKAIQWLIQNPGLNEELRIKARLLMEEKYDWERITEQVKDIVGQKNNLMNLDKGKYLS